MAALLGFEAWLCGPSASAPCRQDQEVPRGLSEQVHAGAEVGSLSQKERTVLAFTTLMEILAK